MRSSFATLQRLEPDLVLSSENAAPRLIYIVILSWNQLDDTLECLDSLRRFEQPGCRVVIIDNGSSDGTVESVRQQFPTTHIIENGRNLGYAEGNNTGVRYALEQGADYVLLLNSDTVVTPTLVSDLLAEAESDSTIGILGPCVTSYFDRSRNFLGTDIDWKRGIGIELERKDTAAFDTAYVPGCALLIRSDVIVKIGLLDPAYFAYFEDVDWSLRCKKAGYRVVAVPAARVYHKGTGDRVAHKDPIIWYYGRRNQCLFARKYSSFAQRPGFFRKFSVDCMLQIRDALDHKNFEAADAVADGWWAGTIGCKGAERALMPEWGKRLVFAHADFLVAATSPIATLRKRFPVRTTLRRLLRTGRTQL